MQPACAATLHRFAFSLFFLNACTLLSNLARPEMASLDATTVHPPELEQVAMADPMDATSTRPAAQDDPKNAKEVLKELLDKFHDFDDVQSYEALMNDALEKDTANFAVRFGVDKSEIANNLNEQDLGALLQVQADEKNDLTTWM